MSEAQRPLPTASDLVDALLERIDLEEIDQDIYRGQNEPMRIGRLFGGQVAAQSLSAAGRTIEGLLAHSLHAYFLRPGDPAVPVIYRVDRIRDGRSFTTRRVVAQQRGQAIFNMSVSFHKKERGYEHQTEMPKVPEPEELPTMAELVERMTDQMPEEARQWAPRPRPIDMRHVVVPTYMGGEATEEANPVWMRVARKLSDDLFLHQCLLTYASDMSLVDTIVQRHGRRGSLGPLMVASLDHALWFHRPARIDDWLLYVQESPVASGARGFARGTVYTRDGALVASVAQEGLVRPVRKPDDRSH